LWRVVVSLLGGPDRLGGKQIFHGSGPGSRRSRKIGRQPRSARMHREHWWRFHQSIHSRRRFRSLPRSECVGWIVALLPLFGHGLLGGCTSVVGSISLLLFRCLVVVFLVIVPCLELAVLCVFVDFCFCSGRIMCGPSGQSALLN
jgi:hypothetical protein